MPLIGKFLSGVVSIASLSRDTTTQWYHGSMIPSWRDTQVVRCFERVHPRTKLGLASSGPFQLDQPASIVSAGRPTDGARIQAWNLSRIVPEMLWKLRNSLSSVMDTQYPSSVIDTKYPFSVIDTKYPPWWNQMDTQYPSRMTVSFVAF